MRQTHEFEIQATHRARADNSKICYRKKQVLIDNEFRHNIVKVICGSNNHITGAVAATDSCFGFVRPHQHVGAVGWEPHGSSPMACDEKVDQP